MIDLQDKVGVEEPLQDPSYGVVSGLKDAFSLTVNTFGAFEDNQTGRNWKYDPDFNIASDKAKEIFNRYGVHEADTGQYVDENNYHDLEIAIQKHQDRRKKMQDLSTNFPVAQYPMLLATSLIDPVDLVLAPTGFKLLSSFESLNSLGRLGNVIKLGGASTISATASEYLLEEESADVDKHALIDTAIYSGVFGGGIGALLPVMSKVKDKEAFIKEVTGTKKPTKGDFIGSPHETKEDYEAIFNDFKHIDKDSEYKEAPMLKGALSKLVWSPIAKVMKSENTMARYVGKMLESPATAMQDPTTGHLVTTGKTAMNIKSDYEGLASNLRKSMQLHYGELKRKGTKINYNDYARDITKRLRSRNKKIETQAYEMYFNKQIDELADTYVSLKKSLHNSDISKEDLFEVVEGKTSFREPEDFEDILIEHLKKDIEKKTELDDDLKLVVEYYEKHQVDGEEMGHPSFVGKSGRTYINRVHNVDKITKDADKAFKTYKQGILAHPSSKREIEKSIQKLIKQGKKEEEAIKEVYGKLDELVKTMIYNMKDANIIKNMSVRELTTNVKGTSPFNKRKLKIDEEVIEDYLVNNAEALVDIYSFKTSGKLALKRMLNINSLDDVQAVLAKVRQEGINQGLDAKQIAKDVDNLEVLFNTVWGHREIADRPNLLTQKMTRWAKKTNTITLAGRFGWVNTLMEVGTVVSAHGLKSLSHFVPAWKEAIKMYRAMPTEKWVDEINAIGYAMDIYAGKAMHRYDSIDNMHSGGAEKVLDRGVNLMYHLNGQNFMTTVMELMSAPATLINLVKKGEALKAGKKLSKADLKQMSRLGVTEDDLIKLVEEAKYIERDSKGHIKAFNFEKWADEEVAYKIQQSIREGIKEAVVQADASTVPSFVTDPNNILSQLMFQYLRFPMAAHERVFLKTLDELSYKSAIGVLTSMGILGIILTLREEALVAVGAIKEKDRKYNIFDDDEEAWKNLGRAVWGKTAHLGFLQPMTDYMFAMVGKQDPFSDYQATADLGNFGGVTLSRIQQAQRFFKDSADGKWGNGSINFVKHMTPYNTVPILDEALNVLADKIKEK